MDNDSQIGEQGADRRRMIKAGAAGVGVLAAAIATTSSPVSAARGGNSVDLRVIADPSQLDLIPSPTFPGQGPFYIPGTIYAPGTLNQLGIFHCWGFFYNGGALGVVSQEYDLAGRGKIQVQGVEDGGPRAVTGGTGDFRNVRGEMTGADLSAFPDFTVNFQLIG